MELIRAGYLRRGAYIENELVLPHVTATAETFEAVREQFDVKLHSAHVKTESPVHDIGFVDAGHRLRSLALCVKFYTENLLRSSLDLSDDEEFREITQMEPDAAIILRAKDGSGYLYAIEYERTAKASARYVKKLTNYYGAISIQGVLYICSTQKIADIVANADRIACTTPLSKVLFTLEDTIKANQEVLQFQRIKGDKIRLR